MKLNSTEINSIGTSSFALLIAFCDGEEIGKSIEFLLNYYVRQNKHLVV